LKISVVLKSLVPFSNPGKDPFQREYGGPNPNGIPLSRCLLKGMGFLDMDALDGPQGPGIRDVWLSHNRINSLAIQDARFHGCLVSGISGFTLASGGHRIP
jgi:hypothetical protein